MNTFNRFSMAVALLLCVVQACYYAPKTRRAKAHPSFLSESEAESLIANRLEPYGIKFVYNMRLRRENAAFVADGYDRTLRVGFEYRSHEGMDFEGEEGQSPDGLSAEEIAILRAREQPFREFFLIMPEETREKVEKEIKEFIKNLYVWEVLRRPKRPKSIKTGTRSKEKSGLLPWESSDKIDEKLKEMEAREELDKDTVRLDEDKSLQEWLDPDQADDIQDEDDQDELNF